MWEHLDTGSVGEKPLDLYRDGNAFMIRVDGLELMNSRWHRSEKALAQAARAAVTRPNRILIGGLGLGFTLAAFEDEFVAEILCAEKSQDVIRWFHQYMGATTSEIWSADVSDVMQTRGPFDLIVLDVDNGPEALSSAGNSALYSEEGLKLARETLRPQGALLVWSGFQSDEFAERARAAGFKVKVEIVNVGWHEHQHYIYILSLK